MLQDPTAFLDGTGGGERCDFCRWEQLTAQDAGFGRVALQHAVTGESQRAKGKMLGEGEEACSSSALLKATTSNHCLYTNTPGCMYVRM
jgi:hypothetical protein